MRHTTPFARESGWIGLVLATTFAGMAQGQAVASGVFTEDELARLTKGELVTRPVEERRGRFDLVGGTSWQVIDAAPEVVWRALLDVPRFAKMIPRVLEARVVDGAGDQRTVFVRQGTTFVQTTYHMKFKYDDAAGHVRFALDDTRPHDIAAAWGFYSVRPYHGGRTLLTYGIMADLGGGLVQMVVRGVVHEWMLKTPWMVKRFVEGSGRWIYR